MKLPPFSLAGLATTVAATNLYVSSYSGNVTSLTMGAVPQGGYSIKSTYITNGSAPSPSWLTKDPSRDVLYCVNEALSGGNGSIASYKTSGDGHLTLIDHHATVNGPVHTTVYNKGQGLVAAFYGDSALASWTISADGSLTPLQSISFLQDPAKPQPPRPHEVLLDPTGGFIVVPDLGSDLLRVFSIDQSTSRLTEQPSYTVANGTGPRHGAFLRTPCGKTYLFVVTELKPTVTTYLVTYVSSSTKHTSMTFTPVFTNSTYGPNPIPAPVRAGSPFAAEALVSPCGNYLLTSSRGDNLFNITNPDKSNSTKIPSDSLQVWSIDHATGALDFKQLAPAGGLWPRQFSLNKNGTLAAVALQSDSRVAVIERKGDGMFGDIVAYVDVAGEVTSVIFDE